MTSPERNPVEKLSEEFLERHRRGERPSVEEYASRYPDLADEIRDLFPALLMMEELKPASVDVTGAYSGAAGPREGKKLDRLGDFRILREVGRGGMGIVYEAEQESLGRRVALKVLPGQALLDPQQQKRFQREARAAARLHHTNIVPVFGVGEHEGLHYYVMQFIQGLGLDEVLGELKRLRRARSSSLPQVASAVAPEALSAAGVAHALLTGQFQHPAVAEQTPTSPAAPVMQAAAPRSASTSSVVLPGAPAGSVVSESGRHYWQSVARIGIQVADALEYAHEQGLFHRDIKPSNLLLDTQGTVWVTDFGLAKASADGDNLTHTGDIVGTLRYMAPERFQGQSDARGDVYSLGLTLYELLVQRPAFDETDRNKLIHQVTHLDPPQPRKVNPAIPRDLETVILKAIDREPARRYATAGALAEDLRRFVDDKPIQARRVSKRERLWRWCRRNPALAGAAGLAATALVAVTALSVAIGLIESRSAEDQKSAYIRLSIEQGLTRQALDRSRDLANNLEEEQKRTKKALTDSEDAAGRLAVEKKRTDAALTESQRLSANLLIERGQALIDQQDPRRGMLWLARGMELAPPDAADLQRLARAKLAGARSELLALRAVLPHAGSIEVAVFSPDGQTIATGGADQALRLWSAADGTPVGKPLQLQGVVRALSFRPDGRTVFTVRPNQSDLLWDGVTGRAIGSPLSHDTEVVTAVFSPDGTRLATGCRDGKARLWDATTGRLVGQALSNEGRGAWVIFSPDGKTLLTAAGPTRSVRFWDAATGRLLRTLTVQRSPGNVTAAFSPDGTTLLTSGWETHLWRAADGKPLGQPAGQPATLVPLAGFRPDGAAYLTAGIQYETVQQWDTATGKAIGPAIPYSVLVRSTAYSPDGRILLMATHDGTARLWDADSGQPIGLPWSHPAPVKRTAFSPDGRRILTVCDEQMARLWDQPTGRLLQAPLTHRDAVRLVVFSPDGKRILTANSDARSWGWGDAQVWDTASGRPVGTVLSHRAAVIAAVFGPDGRTLRTQSADGRCRLWTTETGSPLGNERVAEVHSPGTFPGTADGKTTLVYAVSPGRLRPRLWDMAADQPAGELLEDDAMPGPGALSPDGRTALAVSGGASRLCDTATGKLLGQPLQLPGPIGLNKALFSPDGKVLATWGSDRVVRLWDATTGAPVGEPLRPEGFVSRAAFSPDGQIILAISDKTVRLWERTTGKPLGRPLQHEAAVMDVAFSPDGETVLTGSNDWTARLWHTRTGQPLGPPMTHQGAVLSVAFSPVGDLVLTGSADRTARLWEAQSAVDGDVPRLVRWVETSSGLELTQDNAVRVLDGATWQKRRQELDERGGAPAAGVGAGRFGFGWHQRLAAEAMGAGHWFTARWHLDHLLAARPDDWLSYAQRAHAHYELGGVKAAAEDCKRAVEKGPAEPVRDWFSRQSPEHDATVRWEAALWYLDQLVAARPGDGLAHALRVRAYVELDKREQATTDCARALELGPREEVQLLLRSYAGDSDTREKWTNALWYAHQLLPLRPRDQWLQGLLPRAHLRLGHLQQAELAYQMAIELNPNNLQAYLGDAVLCLRLGDTGGYRRVCARAMRYTAGNAAFWPGWAVWLGALAPDGLAGAAPLIRSLETDATKFPANANFWRVLGAAAYRAGRPQEAARYLDEAVKREGDFGHPATCLFLALAQYRLGKVEKARQWVERAARQLDNTATNPEETDYLSRVVSEAQVARMGTDLLREEAEVLINGTPDTSDAGQRIAYARAHLRLGQWEQAATEFTRAQELRPDEFDSWGQRGRCYARLGQWERAAGEFDRAVSLRPDDVELLVERTACCRQLNQPEKAAADYDKVMTLTAPELAERKTALEKAPTQRASREALTDSYRDLAERQRRMGRLTEAAATAEQVRQLWPGHAAHLYATAALLASWLSAASAKPTAEEEAQRRGIADRAMAVLGEAVLAGYRDTDALDTETAWQSLRSREDFQALRRELTAKSEFAYPTGEIRRFTGLSKPATAVAISLTGRVLAGGTDKTVRQWIMTEAGEPRTLGTFGQPVVDISLSPTGLRARCAGGERDVREWDVTTAQELPPRRSPMVLGGATRILPDGRRVLTNGTNLTLFVVDLETGETIHRLTGHQGGAVPALAVSPDGRRALSGGDDGTVRHWDLENGRQLRRLDGHEGVVWSVAFSPDGRRALSGGWDGFVRLWDLESGRQLGMWAGHWDVISCVAWTPDGRRAISGGQGKRLLLWDVATGRVLHRFAAPADPQLLCVTPNGRQVLTADSDNYLRLWSLSEDAARGRDLARLGQATEAEEACNRAVAACPEEPALRGERGRILARQGRWEQAVADLSAALQANPPAVDLTGDRARCHAALKHWDQAAADFAAALARVPPTGAPWWVGGTAFADDMVRRDEVFERVARLRPNDRGLWSARTRYHAWHGRWADAVADSARLLAIEPGAPPHAEMKDYQHLTHACLQVLAGDREGYRRLCRQEAVRLGQETDSLQLHLVDRVCALAPGALDDPQLAVRIGKLARTRSSAVDRNLSAVLRYGLGAACYRAGLYDEAVNNCRVSTDQYPDWSGTCLNWPVLALAHHQLGQSEDARRWLDKVAAFVSEKRHGRAADDGNPLPRLHAVNWLELQVLLKEAEGVLNVPHRREAEDAMNRERWQDAVAHLDPLIASDPAFWPDRSARARCYALLGRWPLAVADFAKVIELRPDDAVAWYHLAAARLGAGDLPAYQRTCADLLEKFDKTENPVAASRVLYARVPVAQPGDEARQLVRLAGIAAQEWKGNVRVLGAVLCRAGKYEEAVQRFEEASRDAPYRAWDHLFLAMAQHHLGHAGKAKQHLHAALEWAEEADRPAAGDGSPRPAWAGWFERVEVAQLRREVEPLLKEPRPGAEP
jgi:WD40 repeat protein/serine/threonine protein kinase/Tfp pilus assembly protein PilF